MSNYVFPPSTITPSLAWGNTKTPTFATAISGAESGRESRASKWVYPRWRFNLTYHVLNNASGTEELRAVLGFFLSRGGAAESFIYMDTEDYSVTDQAIAVGDDATTEFQLLRTYGGFVEPVYAPKLASPAPTIKLDGVTKTITTHYTLDADGVLKFVAPPGAGVLVTWSGQYYFRVRFAQDEAELEEFMVNLWKYQRVELIGVGSDA